MDNKDIWLNNTNSTLNKVKLDKLHYFLYCIKQNVYMQILIYMLEEFILKCCLIKH